jgi:phosphopentomutase
MPIVLLLVLDAVGIKTLEYLLDHYTEAVRLPNLARLGLGTLLDQRHQGRFSPMQEYAYATALTQASASADSVIGHREMCGVIDERIYKLFPNGFPDDYLNGLSRSIGRRLIGNLMLGGMEAITHYNDDHVKTGCPIVYASKCDPLIQFAMNEAVIPVAEQHQIAETALKLALVRGVPLTRAIARSYRIKPDGSFDRTANRHDAVLPLDGPTLIDILRQHNVWTVAVGKTGDLVNTTYDERIAFTNPVFLDPNLGLHFVHPNGNDTNPFMVQGTLNALASARVIHRPKGTFVFANFVDTDSLFGHTRDVAGAIRSIEEFDRALPFFEKLLQPGDQMMITADHGISHQEDYGYHSLEPVPFLIETVGTAMPLPSLGFDSIEGLTEVGLQVARTFNCLDPVSQSIRRIQA